MGVATDVEEQQKNNLPSPSDTLRKRLHHAHSERCGLDSSKAEEMFITNAQSLTDYGAHYCLGTADSKELGKIIARQKKYADRSNSRTSTTANQPNNDDEQLYSDTENIYEIDKNSDFPIYGRIDFNDAETRESISKIPYTDEEKIILSRNPTPVKEDSGIYSSLKNNLAKQSSTPEDKNAKNSGSSTPSKARKNDVNAWLAIQAQGLKIFDRDAKVREKQELAKFLWRDIQTLSYGKNCLVVHTKINGKRYKFKLRMEHRK